jgi:ABC-type sugar transport system permease subunit
VTTSKSRGERFLGLGMVAPMLVLFAVFGLYPFARTLQLSFTDWDGLSASFHYVGDRNYIQALHDAVWWTSLEHGLFSPRSR